jgi:hypothetical protein
MDANDAWASEVTPLRAKPDQDPLALDDGHGQGQGHGRGGRPLPSTVSTRGQGEGKPPSNSRDGSPKPGKPLKTGPRTIAPDEPCRTPAYASCVTAEQPAAFLRGRVPLPWRSRPPGSTSTQLGSSLWLEACLDCLPRCCSGAASRHGAVVGRWSAGTRSSRSAVSSAISLDLPEALRPPTARGHCAAFEAGRLADADSEPPHPASRREDLDPPSPLARRRWTLAPAAWRFPGEPVRGVRLEVMSVLYWH